MTEEATGRSETVPHHTLRFQTVASLIRLRSIVPNRDQFFHLRDSLDSYNSPADIPQPLVDEATQLVEQTAGKSTAVIRELPTLDEQTNPDQFPPFGRFTSLADIDFLTKKFPDAKFFFFENQVGNWKPVLLIEHEGKKYVVKKVNKTYQEKYNAVKAAENRPDALFIPSESEETDIGLFAFMGDETADFTNPNHLKQIVDLGIASALRNTTFDCNPGNFVVNNGKVYYVDTDLAYVDKTTFGKALISNIVETIQNIPYIRPFSEDYNNLVQQVFALYREKLAQVPQEKKDELKEASFVNEFDEEVEMSFAPYRDQLDIEQAKQQLRSFLVLDAQVKS